MPYHANYFTLAFLIRRSQVMKSGEVPVFARISIGGQRTEFNINRSVEPENWNSAKGMPKGHTKKDIKLSKHLDSIRVRISEILAQLVKDEEVINPIVLKNHYLGNIAGPKMLCEVFQEVVDQYKDKLEVGDVFKIPNYSTCNKHLKRWVKASGIKKWISWHCARHSFAVNVLDKGANIKTVSTLMGHCGIEMTEKYLHVLDRQKQAAVDSLGAIDFSME